MAMIFSGPGFEFPQTHIRNSSDPARGFFESIFSKNPNLDNQGFVAITLLYCHIFLKTRLGCINNAVFRVK